MTRGNAPAAPALPVMPPSGQVSKIVQELGLTMGGVSNPAYCAFAWRFSRDQVAYWPLKRHLLRATYETARRLHWPFKMRNRFYLHRLVWLAVAEEHNWYWIREGKAWPRLIGMEDDLWHARVAAKYSKVRDQLDAWCESALARARRNHE